MILIDISSTIHRKIHTAISNIQPKKENGKYVTSQYINLVKYYIFQDLFDIEKEHGQKFGEMILCIDNKGGSYWRNDVYPLYKNNRIDVKDDSEVNFKEVFAETNVLIDQIKKNLPWKVIDVPRTEADDIMLVLAKEYSNTEKVLIFSPDKDMIQAQRYNDNVFQYSALTKKWIVPENKHDNMDHWIQEHICLGDSSDGVPKIVDHTEFSENFKLHIKLQKFNYPTVLNDILNPIGFKKHLKIEDRVKLIESFKTFKQNRKGEFLPILDVYKDMRFGPVKLQEAIRRHGSLDKWLDSNELYRKNYERNFKLVMDEGIPTEYWNKIVLSYKTADTEYNIDGFNEYLNENNLQSLSMELPASFKINRKLTASDFNW